MQQGRWKQLDSGATTANQNTAYIIPASPGQNPGGGSRAKPPKAPRISHFKNLEMVKFSSRGECGEKQQGRVVTVAIFG